MTIYYLQLSIKETSADYSLMSKLRLLWKLKWTVKRFGDAIEALPPDFAVEIFEKFNAQLEQWIDSGLIKDGYKFFEGDYVFITGDLTVDQLNELNKKMRAVIVQFVYDILAKLGKPTTLADYMADEIVKIETHRALPLRRALAATLAAAKRGVAKGA
jgi:hypothetical protein